MAGEINQSLMQVKQCLDSGNSFVVEAGAGSGKTWTLIEAIKHLIYTQGHTLEKANQQIACITYTNVAKDEIIKRIDNNSLVLVLTIHEFLWLVIKSYQKQLKDEIIQFNKCDTKKPVENLENKIRDLTIDYSQYGRKFEKGKITHEDVLNFSNILFRKYPKLSHIVSNKFPFLFIDEYQDTEQRTVELFLDDLLQGNKDKTVLGFFGDSMQKIYNQGIGQIPQKYFDNDILKLITKKENYRCSIKVIELLANIRPSLIQNPSGKNLDGEINFIHCNNNINSPENNYQATLEFLKNKKEWVFEANIEGISAKILLLTHKGIANKLGYKKLLAVYDILDFGRDRLFNKEELFSNFFLNKIENLVTFYQNKNYHDFIKQLGIEGFILNSHNDKIRIKTLINSLIELRENHSVREVLEFIINKKLLVKPVRLEEFEIEIQKEILGESDMKKKKFYDSLMMIKYSEFILLNNFIEKYTPYSTKHGVKGDEYDNVLVVIDDNSWNQYKFNDVFANIKSNIGRFERTLNLLYVCCSRAKNNLTILSLSNMDRKAIDTIEDWFGSENLHDVFTLP